MYRLEQEFGEQIMFVDLDIDDRSLEPIRVRYGISGRTQYVLVDANDNVVQRWFGPLIEAEMRSDLQGFLDQLDE